MLTLVLITLKLQILVGKAGSERVKHTGAIESKVLKEASNINKSLFNLGKVISALDKQARQNKCALQTTHGVYFNFVFSHASFTVQMTVVPF